MARYVVAVAVLGLYAAVAAWVVGEEGRAYRAAHRRGAERARDRSEAKLADKVPPPPPAPPAVAPEPSPAPKPAPPPPVAVAEATPPRPHHSPPASHSTAKPHPAPAKPHPDPKKPDPFWLTPRMQEVWDPAQLAPADEERLGSALRGVVRELSPPMAGGPYLRRADRAAAPLRAAGRKGAEYKFTILESDAVNAFSHPGGYIYLTKGLFDFVGGDEDEDFVLQFVIAHEMAHLEQGHAVKCLKDPDLSKSGLGTIPQFCLFLFPLGYPDAMEREADRLAFERMTGPLNLTRHAALSFLRRYKGYAERNGFEDGREGLKPVPELSPLDNHMRAHPPAWKRLDWLTAPAAKPAP